MPTGSVSITTLFLAISDSQNLAKNPTRRTRFIWTETCIRSFPNLTSPFRPNFSRRFLVAFFANGKRIKVSPGCTSHPQILQEKLWRADWGCNRLQSDDLDPSMK